jgi:hypothetical protein
MFYTGLFGGSFDQPSSPSVQANRPTYVRALYGWEFTCTRDSNMGMCDIWMFQLFGCTWVGCIVWVALNEVYYLKICRIYIKVKVKCTLVQALRLCTGRTANRGSRGIALLFHDHGTRRGWWVSVTSRPLFTPGKDPVPIVQEAGWAPGPVWTGAENLSPTGIRSPDRPARSQSLYSVYVLRLF